MITNQELANILFPGVRGTPEGYEARYPARNLPADALVSRYAPSPTGFIHLGALYACLIAGRMAQQSGGIFFLRIEDTDKKREITDGVTEIVTNLKTFGVNFDEGPVDLEHEKGSYGPYKQSIRKEIYQTFVKWLIGQGMAYPCFCSEQDIDAIRARQDAQKTRTGYYGEWAVHRHFTAEQAQAELAKGKSFIVRFRSPGNPERKFTHKDLIKGRIDMFEHDQDIVLIKSDGLPTYHFAHLVDDHLMRTTHVIRGDEWLSSVPLHLQLFAAMHWEAPQYAHIAPIVKEDGKSRRKLSKRKDPEAAIRFYHEQGFPKSAIIEYLLNIANSSFEDWRKANPRENNFNFKLDFKKMSISGALFDMAKLADISKNIISLMPADTVYSETIKWAEEFDLPLLRILARDPAVTKAILNIDREVPKPRKDIAKWSDVRNYVEYFFDELFTIKPEAERYTVPENILPSALAEVLETYLGGYFTLADKNAWFDKVRIMSEKLGYAGDMKAYRTNPQGFKGHVGDISTMLRIAITGRINSPDLFEIQRIMKPDMVTKRIRQFMAWMDSSR